MDVRLIIDRPVPGDWNMAMDEALLRSVGEADGTSCLRFYFWDQPTLSLGYFQPYEDRLSHPASRHCPVVRRSTGGGAIIHAMELTYSFVIPLSSHLDNRSHGMYAAFHETLIDELATRGIGASLCRTPTQLAEEPFLCFLRRADGDVLLGGHKIGGSAQRRHRRGLLQHGSVLLKSTQESPELKGIEDISDKVVDPHELAENWSRRLSERLKMDLRPGLPQELEVEDAKKWLEMRFAHEHWTRKR